MGGKTWQFSDFPAEKKRSQAEPSRAENTSAHAMAQVSLARSHHYYLCSTYELKHHATSKDMFLFRKSSL